MGFEESATLTTGGQTPASEGILGRTHLSLTVGIVLCVGTVAFESLGVATVLPVIADDLDGIGAYGWGLSALMLTNIVGTVIAGRSADRRGPAPALTIGMIVFAGGCVLAGIAGTWEVFLAGRSLQGLGVGAVMAMAYTVIGTVYPNELKARMFAVVSSAWTIPSLVGPALAGILAHSATWRAVFLLLLPVIALAALLTVPGVRHRTVQRADVVKESSGPRLRHPVVLAILLSAGTGLVLQSLLLGNVWLIVVVAVVGLCVALPALVRILPAGTLTARNGIGAGIMIRAALCAAYFGSEAFLPLGLRELRHQTPTYAGLGLSAGAITWVVGAALQARQDGSGQSRRPRSVAWGSAVLSLGVATIASTVLWPSTPSWFAVVGWAIGGLGMGVAFNAATTEVLEQAPTTQQGRISAALQLAQTLSTAIIAGLGGGVVALIGGEGSGIRPALTTVFVLTGLIALLGAGLARRLAFAR